MKWLIPLLFICLISQVVLAQTDYKVICVGFYNMENLFDTIDSPDTDDTEFLPHGANLYTSKVYHDKLDKLAKVISEMGTKYTPDGPALLGVSEIENRTVLEDFVRHPLVAQRGYKILHYDSPDGRGVDVALLYQPKYFKPAYSWNYPLMTNDPGESPRYSRDILFVTGHLDGELVSVQVGHWPSRRGGEQTTAHLRNKAAEICRRNIDLLEKHTGITKSIVMGDLNDDPVNDSVRKYLRAKREAEGLKPNEMYNPFEEFYRKGLGTTAYQDAWSLFDQIVLSQGLTMEDGYRYHKAVIHNPTYLTQRTGVFAGYPLRTYADGVYAGGYSDHFPVYVLLVKPKA